MNQTIATVTLVVPDYDAAIAYYCGVLGFALLDDTDMGGGKRWVTVAPPGGGARLLLARAVNAAQRAAIGNQAGGRVFLFLSTDDFDADHARHLKAGVNFLEAPRSEPYGKVAVFEDAFGNKWDFIENRDA